jgi:hypothetical protein
MKNLLLASTLLAAVGATPAHATLQLSIDVNGHTFSCSDGELSCDESGGANNLLVIDTTVGGALVQVTLAQSSFGKVNELQLSSSNIINETGGALVVSLFAGDNNFVAPTSEIRSSGSLTFNQNITPLNSSLSFFADPANVQGANPTNTPGELLEFVSGHATTDPFSVAGTRTDPFDALSPFSMTESARLAVIAGGSVTGFQESMQSGVPEPKTWAMLGIGFAIMAFMGVKRSRKDRLATI